jgi:outer membrane protein assembly factor BamD (BamD/ComL family)
MEFRLIAAYSRTQKTQGWILLLAAVLAGCQSSSQLKRPDASVSAASPAADGAAAGASAAVSTADGVAKANPAPVSVLPPQYRFKGIGDLLIAEDLYLLRDWKRAGKLFGLVAEDQHNPPMYAEKARFYEGECELMQDKYADAMATYNRLIKDFAYGLYREKALRRMFDIANYWLDDTRLQFDMEQQKADGKRSFVPWNFVHFEKTKPLLDEEGSALKYLEIVFYNDPTGPNADKALFMAGYVYFRRSNFREADQIFSALVENIDKQGKKSDYRDRALEMAILAKRNCVDGPDYDPRKATESLKLVQQARLTSPELANKQGNWLDQQVEEVRYMQAEKDYAIGEFYRRTGHPASAWFYYELVRRRYPGTAFHDKAVAHMKEISGDLASQQEQTALVRATRRELNKIVWGHDVPTLAANAKVPTIPGEPSSSVVGPPAPPSSGVTTVSGQQGGALPPSNGAPFSGPQGGALPPGNGIPVSGQPGGAPAPSTGLPVSGQPGPPPSPPTAPSNQAMPDLLLPPR